MVREASTVVPRHCAWQRRRKRAWGAAGKADGGGDASRTVVVVAPWRCPGRMGAEKILFLSLRYLRHIRVFCHLWTNPALSRVARAESGDVQYGIAKLFAKLLGSGVLLRGTNDRSCRMSDQSWLRQLPRNRTHLSDPADIRVE